jgi:hypothetical protein
MPMRTYALSIIQSVAVAVFLTAPASAVPPSGEQLLVSGQSQVCADTNQNGCPDAGDGCCSANVFRGNPPLLQVLCYQPPVPTPLIRGLAGGPNEFDFAVVAFDLKAQSGELQQTNAIGTDVDMVHPITSAKGFVRPGTGGLLREVTIDQPPHSSSGMLCNQGGPAVVVQTGPNAPRMLFGLQEVNCSSCPCVPDTQNPTHLKVTGPLRTVAADGGLLVTRDAFIPLQGMSLTLSLDGTSPTSLGSIPLGGLGSCVLPAAPTASEIGLVLLTLALLAAGAWALGRRRTFSESIPLP